MGWIGRTFRCRQANFMKVMWKQLLQHHVDYCGQLYYTGDAGEMEMIENLQRTFIKKISGTDGLNYWNEVHSVLFEILKLVAINLYVIFILPLVKLLKIPLEFFNTVF